MSLSAPRMDPQRMVLAARTAQDLMTAKPITIGQQATVREATALLAEKGLSALPVVDEAGRPVGVLSHSDVLNWLHRSRTPQAPAGTGAIANLPVPSALVLVKEIMTPMVAAVTPTTSVCEVIEQIQALAVHRLFVVDERGLLVGVISPLDLLERLRARDAC